jgi:hypothetical protein
VFLGTFKFKVILNGFSSPANIKVIRDGSELYVQISRTCDDILK